MLSNISAPLLAMVDTAVMGRMPGPHFLGGVAVGSTVFTVFFFGFNFLRMGTTGLTAQALGSKHSRQASAWLGRGLVLALILGLVCLLLRWPLAWLALSIIQADAQVTEFAALYFHIRVWAMPVALLNLVCLGWFIGIQKTRAALWVQLLLNGCNILLDLWFVLGLGWGVAGAAWATVLAELAALALSLWLVRLQLKERGWSLRNSDLWQSAAMRRFLVVNRDIFLRSTCLQTAFFIFTSMGARLGELTLAANAVMMNFQIISAYVLDGLANAAEALTGEAFGLGSRRQLKYISGKILVCALLLAMAFSLGFLVLGQHLIMLLTNLEAVRLACSDLLPWAIALPLISIWSFLLDGIFIGTTHTRAMRNSMAFSLLVFVIALALMVPAWGNHGLWASFSLFMLTRGLTMAMGWPRLMSEIGPKLDE